MARPREYPACPRCRKNFTRRSQRQGVVEQVISLVYAYPFRCQLCAHRFYAIQWGVRFERYIPDRREHMRIPVQATAFFSSELVQGQGTVVNLSMRGCGLQTATRLQPGDVFGLKLEGLDGSSQIAIDAAVVRSFGEQEACFEVLRIHDTEREKLRRVIETLLPTGKEEQAP